MGPYQSRDAKRMRYVTYEMNQKASKIRFFYLVTPDLARVYQALETLKDIYHINVIRTTYYSPVYQFNNGSTKDAQQKITLSVGVQTTVAETTKVSAGLNISASSYATLSSSFEKDWSKQHQDTTTDTLEIDVVCEGGKRTVVLQKFQSFIFFLSTANGDVPAFEAAVQHDEESGSDDKKKELMGKKREAFLADTATFRNQFAGQHSYDDEVGSYGRDEELDCEYSFAQLTNRALELKYELREMYTVLDFHYTTAEFMIKTFDSIVQPPQPAQPAQPAQSPQPGTGSGKGKGKGNH